MENLQNADAHPVRTRLDSKPPDWSSLAISKQLVLLNQNLARILEVFPKLKSRPVLVNGKLSQLASREEVAAILGVQPGTIDRWSRNGIIPKPYNPEKSKRGPKLLKWDLYEVLEWIRQYR